MQPRKAKGLTAAERRRSIDAFILTDDDRPAMPETMRPVVNIAQERDRVINEALQNVRDGRHVNNGILHAIASQGFVLASRDGTYKLSERGRQRLTTNQLTAGTTGAHPAASVNFTDAAGF